MNENIICTEDDKNFILYKDKVKDKKVRFKIKDILKDHWEEYYSQKNLSLINIDLMQILKSIKI